MCSDGVGGLSLPADLLPKALCSTHTDSMPGAGQGPEEMKAVERRSRETPSREGADQGVGSQSTFKRCVLKVQGSRQREAKFVGEITSSQQSQHFGDVTGHKQACFSEPS